jgi:hypothetical protein
MGSWIVQVLERIDADDAASLGPWVPPLREPRLDRLAETDLRRPPAGVLRACVLLRADNDVRCDE